MRIKRIIKNGTWAILAYVVMMALNLYTRSLFLCTYDNSILGYSGMISNVFALLSIVEFGVGNIIYCFLFKAIANKNTYEIAKSMVVLKKLYHYIGILILALSTVMIPIMPFIIVEENTNWYIVLAIYFSQMVNVFFSYFLAYKRVLFLCEQKSYIYIRIDFFVQLVVVVAQIIIIRAGYSYLYYLICGIVGTIISNVVVSCLYNKVYSEIVQVSDNIKNVDIKEVLNEVQPGIAHRIACVIYGGVDNIIVMRFMGSFSVMLLNNYVTIENTVTSLFDKIMEGVQAAIGSVLYEEKKVTTQKLLNGIEIISFLLAIFICFSYILLFQPFINLWIGKEYMLPDEFVLFFALNQYVAWNHRILGYFRISIGDYRQDLKYMYIGAVANILISLVGVKLFGIVGVIFGTFISHIILWFARTKVVFKYMGMTLYKYILRQSVLLCIVLIIIMGYYRFFHGSINSVMGMLVSEIVLLVGIIFVGFIIYILSGDFKKFVEYVKSDLIKE